MQGMSVEFSGNLTNALSATPLSGVPVLARSCGRLSLHLPKFQQYGASRTFASAAQWLAFAPSMSWRALP